MPATWSMLVRVYCRRIDNWSYTHQEKTAEIGGGSPMLSLPQDTSGGAGCSSTCVGSNGHPSNPQHSCIGIKAIQATSSSKYIRFLVHCGFDTPTPFKTRSTFSTLMVLKGLGVLMCIYIYTCTYAHHMPLFVATFQ